MNFYSDEDCKLIVYSKLLDNGYSVILRYIANYSDYNILLNYLYNHLKRPDLIIITKEYFRIGKIDCYKKKVLDYIDDSYLTRGRWKILYTKEEIDQLLQDLNLPGFIPKDTLTTYLDKDNQIKTLKKVVNVYKDNYLL